MILSIFLIYFKKDLGKREMSDKAKVINLLLSDGSLNGIMRVEDSSWYLGEMYSAPRDKIDELLKTNACNKFGIYLLLSSDTVYVGQSIHLKKRIKEHILGKDWWEKAILLTTKDDSFSNDDIDYLESVLINKAFELGSLDVDNKTKGNFSKVHDFRREILNQYLEEAMFLIALVGNNVFVEKKGKNKNKNLITPEKPLSSEQIDLRAKGEVIKFVNEQNIKVGKNRSYAKLQEKKNCFWINPVVEFLENEWWLLLNNQRDKTIHVLKIPANTFDVKYPCVRGHLVNRKDKPQYIDLNLDCNTFVDLRSGCDFSSYLIKSFKY